jgi:hypothetical protein
MALRRDQKTLLIASVLSFALWAVPFLRPVALPLLYLNTHVHELCHALTAMATGGSVDFIAVFWDGSGVTPVHGGSMLLTASAGYVGSALVGGLLLALSRSPKQATSMLWLTSLFIVTSMVLFVRGDAVGVISGIVWAGGLILLAKKLSGDNAVFASQFLGMQMALTSLQAFLVLLKVTTSSERESDAMILQNISGVPAFVWATGWLAFGFCAIGLALVSAWKPARRSKVA